MHITVLKTFKKKTAMKYLRYIKSVSSSVGYDVGHNKLSTFVWIYFKLEKIMFRNS